MIIELNISAGNEPSIRLAQMLHDRFLASTVKVRRGPRVNDRICRVIGEDTFSDDVLRAIVNQLAVDLNVDYITARVNDAAAAQRIGPQAWRAERASTNTDFTPF